MSLEEKTYQSGPWRFVWRGGRLADIFHLEGIGAIDCVEVGDWSWERGEQIAPFTVETLKVSADEWVEESGPDFARELGWL